MELTSQQVITQVQTSKVKEGYLFKKFGTIFSTEWQERWIVLTDNYIMSFEQKQTYSKGCEILAVEDIETLKSYFKRKQDRDLSFRAETKEKNFYLAAATNQDKWAWIGAIERVIDRKLTKVFKPKTKNKQNQVPQECDLIQKTKIEKLSQVVRQNRATTRSKKPSISEKSPRQVIDVPNQQSQPVNTTQHQDLPLGNAVSHEYKQQLPQSLLESPQLSPPQIPKQEDSSLITYQQVISKLFEDILVVQRDMTFLVNFIATLAIDDLMPYTIPIVEVCMSHPNARFFIESVVRTFSLQTDQSKMNVQLTFMILLHQYYDNYFYTEDFKVLVDSLIRNLQLYKSQSNHYHILHLVKSLASTTNFCLTLPSQKKELRQLIQQVQKVSPSQSNRNISKELLVLI